MHTLRVVTLLQRSDSRQRNVVDTSVTELCLLCQRRAQHTKRTLAAVKIQTAWRRYFHQQKYQRFLRAVITIQVNTVC